MLRYSNDNGTTWHEIRIPERSHKLKDLNDEIIQQMRMKKHYNELTSKEIYGMRLNA